MPRPLCFVLMPFGLKRDPAGGPDIDFNRTYETAIKPAILDAELDPVRADHEVTAGVIHKAMFERLLLCDFAVTDLTTANANVFYELGIRHAVRPHTTVLLFAEQQPVPFDVGMLRALPYSLGEHNAFGASEGAALRATLAKRLNDVRKLAFDHAATDSPLVHLLQGYRCPEISHLRTDVFRDQVAYSEATRRSLREARSTKPAGAAVEALAALEQQLEPLDAVETGILVDLFLSYRAVGAFERMIALHARLPEVVRRTVLVREQLAFAVNRKAGSEPSADIRHRLREEASHLLEDIVTERGASGETCGLLGRIYKDQWDEARTTDAGRARGLLKRAIKEYTRGFEADWRDYYPGVNAVTLLDLEGSAPYLAERDRLLPIVRYAVEQRLRGKQAPDYWVHATLLELAVLASAPERAQEHLDDALAILRESWEPETTARNLNLLREVRAARGEDTAWIAALTSSLDEAVRQRKGLPSPAV